MRKAAIAQWILSLVTTPDRSASTVGDLLEAAAGRSWLWFWFDVLRTVWRMVWHDFSAEPARMMGLAVQGVLLGCGILIAVVLILSVTLGISAGIYFYASGTANAPHPNLTIIGQVFGFILGEVLIPFYVGQWLAHRSPEREMAACLAVTILTFAVGQGVGIVWFGLEDSLFKFVLGLTSGLARNLLLQIPMFAGAARIRLRRLATR